MKRNIALDILKLLMAVMVVGLHARFLGDVSPLGSFLTVNGIFRIAVPIFFLINGFYFYPVLLKNNEVYWLKRVFILHVFWTVCYIFWWQKVPSIPFMFVVFKNIFIGYYHLWYLPAMFGAAVLLILAKNVSSTILFVSIISIFLCGVLMQYVGSYHLMEGSVTGDILRHDLVYRNFLFFAFPFFCIGFLIKKHSLHNVISFKSTMILSILGMMLLLGESYINFQNVRHAGFDIYLSLIFVCPFIFILFIKSTISHSGKKLASYSSCLYFIHFFILTFFRYFTDYNTALLTFMTVLTSLLISHFIIQLNGRFKYII